MLSQKLPPAFTTGSTRTRLGLLTGYISASVSLGLCFAMIKDRLLRVPESMTVKQPGLQDAHAALQKDVDALQGKLDCLTQLYSGVKTKDHASISLCPYWTSSTPYRLLSSSPCEALIPRCSAQINLQQALFSHALSAAVMVILSFKLLTPIFNLRSMSRSVVHRRKDFKL